MVPSKFEDWFGKQGTQAKHLFQQHTGREATTLVTKGREQQGIQQKGALVNAALGSDERIYSIPADCGIIAAVYTAYSHHYRLRTSPDDWWFCVIKRVACAINNNSEKESVREMFVSHAGKNHRGADVGCTQHLCCQLQVVL